MYTHTHTHIYILNVKMAPFCYKFYDLNNILK